MENKDIDSILKLKRRFVKDFDIPINLFGDEIFYYLLDLLEERYKAKTLWNQTLKMIEDDFDNEASKFLDYYYKLRNDLIMLVMENEAYKDFIKSKEVMSLYDIPSDMNYYRNADIYNCENENKLFLSVDLNEANYSSLMFHNPLILWDESVKGRNYNEWIGKYTDNWYIKSSKYFRQVLFGKLCVGRQIKIEKFMASKVLSIIKNEFEKEGFSFEIFSLHTDEAIIELLNPSEIGSIKQKLETILDNIKLSIPCKYEIFKLKIHQFLTHNKNVIRAFDKENIENKTKKKLKGLSSVYVPQVLRLIENEPITKFDKMFSYEDQECMFLHELIKIKKNENK